eukprot:1204135-Prymnesium_polylepis.1
MSRFRLQGRKPGGGGGALPPPPPAPGPHGTTPRDGMNAALARMQGHGTLIVIVDSSRLRVPKTDTHVRVMIGSQEKRTSILWADRPDPAQLSERLEFKGALHEFNSSTLSVAQWESKKNGHDHRRSQASEGLKGAFECVASVAWSSRSGRVHPRFASTNRLTPSRAAAPLPQ